MTEQSLSFRLAIGVYAALLALLGLTVWAAGQDVGRWNFVVSLLIAAAKAMLIMWVFMHVRHSSPLTKLVIGTALGLCGIGLVLSLADYWTRGWP